MHDIRSQRIYYSIQKCKALVIFFSFFYFLQSKIQDLWFMAYSYADQPTIPPFLPYSHLSIRPSSFLKENNGNWRNQNRLFPPFSPWAATAWMKSHAATWLHSVKSTISSNPAKVNAQQSSTLLNWDKLFLKCLITVWFSDLYILNCSKDIHNIKTQRAHELHLSRRTWVQAISDRCLLLFNHFSICVIWSEVSCALLMDCLRRTSEKTWAGAIIYPSKYFHLSHHFLSFSMVGRNSDVQPSLFYLIFLRKKIWFNQLQVTASHSRSIQTTGSGKSCELFYLVQILKLVSPPPWLPSSYRIPAFVILYYLHKKCTWIFKRIYPRLTLWAELHFHFVIVRQQYSREPVRPSLKQSNLLHFSKGKVRSSLH